MINGNLIFQALYPYINSLIRNYGTEHGFNYLIIDLLDISLAEKKPKPIETIKYMITAGLW